MAPQNPRWYVIRSKYRNEALLWQQLLSRRIEVYYPRILHGPAKLPAPRAKPYFPGYMFAHIDLDVVGRSTMQWMPGALGLVCFGGEPAYVSDSVFHGIQERVDRMNSARADPVCGLKTGDPIEIYTGPFAGYRGIFGFQLSDRDRAAVFLQFIRDQQIRVELPVTQVRLLKTASKSTLR